MLGTEDTWNLGASVAALIVALLSVTAGLIFNERGRSKREDKARTELQSDEKELSKVLAAALGYRVTTSDSSGTQPKKEEKDRATLTDFASIWAVTQKRIDYYHKIATSQARNSYISSQIATVVGFVIIIVFGVIASQATSPTAAISAGAVGVVGGGLSAYIGSTFMKAQSEATAQLSQFFLQPVEFARLLGAERLIESLGPDQRAEAVHHIVRSMMALPTDEMMNKKDPKA
jgi:ABC-type multidrug transport system fused ATPase/permease subunit